MKATRHLELINNPKNATLEDFDQLIQLIRKFPYCQNYRILAAKIASDNLFREQKEMTHFAALYATNRARLKKLLENSLNFKEFPIKTQRSTDTAPQGSIETKQSSAGHFPKKEDSIAIESTEKTTLSDAELLKRSLQDDIINDFISKNPKISPLQPKRLREDHPTEDLTNDEIKPTAEFISENFAKILLKQGKTKDALVMYNKLMLKKPEKKEHYLEIIKQFGL